MSRVLVLRALGLGDLLVAVPALRGLRRAFPDDHITLAAPGASRELVDLIDAVDDLLPTPGLGALRTQRPPKAAVNLHGCGPESIADLVATSPGTLLSHRRPGLLRLDGPRWAEDRHEVDRWCLLLAHYGIPADRGDLSLPRPPIASPAPGAVVVHPGAAFPARRWPLPRFAAVARAFAEDGRRVVVTGNARERELALWVASAAGLGEGAVLAGATGLAELMALVADAELVVCGDTGTGHLATACGTRSVLLFGPTPPQRWGPPPERDRHVVLWAGRTGDPFGHQPDPGLLRITEADVIAAGRRMMRGGVPCG